MFKQKKKQIILFILIIIATLVLNNFYELKKSKVLLAVYDKYNCNIIQGNINTISRLENSLSSYDEMQAIAEKVLYELDIKSTVEITKNENDNKKEYIVVRNAEDSETIIKIVSNKDEQKNIYNSNLIINVILYNNIDGIGYVQTLLDNTQRKLGTDVNMNITMVGSYDGDMSKQKKVELTERIFRSLKAKKVDYFETDKIYCLYGYTNYIKDSVNIDGKEINTNLAIRYNSYENKTYLYLSTPLITTEY